MGRLYKIKRPRTTEAVGFNNWMEEKSSEDCSIMNVDMSSLKDPPEVFPTIKPTGSPTSMCAGSPKRAPKANVNKKVMKTDFHSPTNALTNLQGLTNEYEC